MGNSFAQQEFKLSGKVHAEQQAVAAVSVKLVGSPQSQVTDSVGFFEFILPPGNYTLEITALGYTKIRQSIKLRKDTQLDFSLSSNSENLDEITISGQMLNRNLASTQMGVERLSAKSLKSIPAIFGEQDIVKAIQFLPGIKSAGEGSSGIFVRGGSSDQNLILMDDVPVYNASHLLGFFSAFNPDAVEDITVYKAGMPANYGGRLSAVLAVKMRSGDMQKLNVSGGIGLISSKLSVDGPIVKNKASFLVAARRTYADALMRLSSDTSINRNILYFYDVNASINIQPRPKDRISFSTYWGADKMGMAKTFGLTWGNTSLSGQWQHQFNNNLASNTLLALSQYQNNVDIQTGNDDIHIYSQLRNWMLKQQFFWQANEQHFLKFGIQSNYHQVVPSRISASASSNYNPVNYQRRFAWENAFYLNDDWQVLPLLNLSMGMRLSAFSVLGGSSYLQLDPQGNILANKTYPAGEVVKTYLQLEPRLAISYLLGAQSSVKLSYVRNSQNMHLISNTSSDRPTDRWLPSSLMIKPESSDQWALGYYLNLANNRYEINVESYYKTLAQQLDYRDGADLLNEDQLETQLLFGKGQTYGVELLLRKKTGRLNGWISYTLAKSEKKIPGINQNQWYNARQDRLHELALLASYTLNGKWSISAVWNYYTGNAVTFPEAKYNIGGRTYFYYTARNGYRMPSYHRLDLNALVQLKKRKHFSSELAFGLYNAYARKNAFSIAFQKSETDPNQSEIVKTTLFKMVPSISYHFKF
jgi:hypothetical protein